MNGAAAALAPSGFRRTFQNLESAGALEPAHRANPAH
ncbi:hypothetical protein COSO111634_37840 [Corallococcus soli]